MGRILFILVFILINNIFASDFKNDKIKIVAQNIISSDGILEANGNVLIYSKEYYIVANKIIYDKKNATMQLFDNVNIIRNNHTVIYTSYAFLDFSTKTDVFDPLFILDSNNNIWIDSLKAKKNNSDLILDNSILSSCDCYDPFWKISFSSGDYNDTTQWINTYNTTLYLKNIPIFYTPYFGFPTDKTRRSGILRPTIGISKQEGWLYAQPIYYAPKKNYDFEFIPQIRTLRGKGYELKYRYKDSPYSMLEVSNGKFQEKEKYMTRYNLTQKEHTGTTLLYNRDKVFAKNNNQDGLYIALNNISDVDYINTKYNHKDTQSVSSLVKSNVKYFYNTNSFYGDINFRYYNDLTKQNNDTTLQELPVVNLHKYTTNIFFDKLLYSTNVTYSNKTRKEGLNAQVTNMVLPLSYNWDLLGDYLHIGYTEQLNLTTIKYDKNINNYSDGKYIEDQHIFTLWTNLLKPYKSLFHTLDLSATYTVPNSIKQTGNLYSINTNSSDLSIVPVTKTTKNLLFVLNQSFYNKKTKTLMVNHKVNQSIIYNKDGGSKLSDLENELTLYYKYGSIYNRSIFNHDDKMVINSTTSLKYNYDNLSANIDYTYSKDTSSVSSAQSFSYKDLPDAKTIKGSLKYKFLNRYTIGYAQEYNIITHISNKKEYSYNVDKKCWALNLTLSDSLVATSSSDVLRQNIIYMKLTLKPLGTIDQKYTQDIRKE